jgi:hypothetical protein
VQQIDITVTNHSSLFEIRKTLSFYAPLLREKIVHSPPRLKTNRLQGPSNEIIGVSQTDCQKSLIHIPHNMLILFECRGSHRCLL